MVRSIAGSHFLDYPFFRFPFLDHHAVPRLYYGDDEPAVEEEPPEPVHGVFFVDFLSS